MSRLVAAKKTLCLTKHGRPAPGTRGFRAKADPGKDCLQDLAGICRRRRRKLLSIRRQLVADTYNIEGRLDAVLDKVLRDVAC